MKPFRLVINGQRTHIQEYKKEMLFGPEWGNHNILCRLQEQV